MVDLKNKRDKIVNDINKIQKQAQQMSETIIFLKGKVNLLDELIIDDSSKKINEDNVGKEGDE